MSVIMTQEKGGEDLGSPGPQSSSVPCGLSRSFSLPGPFPFTTGSHWAGTDIAEEAVDGVLGLHQKTLRELKKLYCSLSQRTVWCQPQGGG